MGVQIKVGPWETGGQVEPKPSDGAEILDTNNFDIIAVNFWFIDATNKELAEDFKLRRWVGKHIHLSEL
jgi:hypothetical protein